MADETDIRETPTGTGDVVLPDDPPVAVEDLQALAALAEEAPAPRKKKTGEPTCPRCGGPVVVFTGPDRFGDRTGTAFCARCERRVRL